MENDKQVGGNHYRNGETVGNCPHCGGIIQHWDLYARQPYLEGIITKWVTRWRFKGGVADLEKAKHAIDKLIEWWAEEEQRQKERAARIGA